MKTVTLDDLRGGRPHEPAKLAIRPITTKRREMALRLACHKPVEHIGQYAFRNGEPAAVAAGGE